MPPPEAPLTRDRILDAAEEVIRRFGPAKATVVDVAQELGVSHAAVYRHVASKAELREAVVARWIEHAMQPVRIAAGASGLAPLRLKKMLDTLIATKRARASADPQLFAAYRTLAVDAQSVVAAHVDDLIGLATEIVSAGVAEGSFRAVDPMPTARAILLATSRFHHPAHAADWTDPGIDADFGAVWQLLMNGLKIPRKKVAPR